MNMKKIGQSSVVLMLVIIVSKIIGMCRDIVLANNFGTSNISDAYIIASSVPVLLFYFIGHSLSTAYIPMYNKVRYERDDKTAMEFSNKVLNASLVISTIIVIVLILFPNIVVNLFAKGFDQETSLIASRLIQISSVSIYLMCVVQVCSGYLQANHSFLAPAAISVPRNIGIVLSVIFAANFGTDILGWGLLLSYLLEMLFLLPFVIKKGYKYKLDFNFNDSNLKETMYIVTPILLGMCVSQINKIIDRSIASTVEVGAISALSYASVINSAVQEVLVTGIITILFSKCAQLVAQGKDNIVLQKLSSTIKTLMFFLVPASIGVIVLAEPIVKVILCRGNFNLDSIIMTTGALKFYTIGLLFLAIRDTLVKVFYAYKETRITTITSIIAIIINIILNLILSKIMGINGLALATSISAIFHCIVLYIILYRKIGDFDNFNNIITVLKCIVAAFFMGIITKKCFIFLENIFNTLVALIISICIGAIVYFFFSIVLRSIPIMNGIKKFKNKEDA